jgi:hypothetical protein
MECTVARFWAWLAFALTSIGLAAFIAVAVVGRVDWDDDIATTRGRVLAKAENPYRCCDTVDCRCQEAASWMKGCSVMEQSLEEGQCAGSSQCCSHGTRRVCTGSGEKRRCTSISYCTRRISARTCTVVCGSCYRPSIRLGYAVNGRYYVSQETIDCDRDDRACVNEFLGAAVVNASATVYYSQEEPSRAWFHDPPYEVPPAIIVFLVLFSTGFVAALVFCIGVECNHAQRSPGGVPVHDATQKQAPPSKPARLAPYVDPETV